MFAPSNKWSHMLAYAVLGAALAWNLIKDKRDKVWVWILGIAIPMLYGGLIEILQGAFFYPRTAEWLDWLADIIGTIIGTALVAGIWQTRN